MPQITGAKSYPLRKSTLLALGEIRIKQFCIANHLPVPEVTTVPREDWHFHVCAYYRPDEGIKICLEHCGTPAGEAYGRNWSWPGSTTDREPYGVLCHELGHHADWCVSERRGSYGGEYSDSVMEESGEPPISGYAPNPWEWFAEMFRVFVTNHALLRLLRPRTHAVLTRKFTPVSRENWVVELGANCPARVLKALRNKL